MGNFIASFCRRRRLRRHIVLILIGLDNAGKTKTVNNLSGEKDDKVLPTVGFKAVNLVHKDTPVTIFDLGGGPEFRAIWPQYYSEVHGVIFVIDSSDFSRLDECRTVLEEVLSHDKIAGKPVLVLANKQDKTGALDDIDVVEKLNIEPLVNRYRCPTLVESYSAQTEPKGKKKIDPGLRKGYHWLLNYICKRYGDINLRVQTDKHADMERRKRMIIKASNRASQTFTAVSDDIATQTGFENPNYELPDREKDMDQGLIIVKPIRNHNNSVDTTLTIESDSDNTSNAKPKLSPLFGCSNSSTTDRDETVRIELEPRSEFQKLSPIVKKPQIDFQNRPQSSPSPTFTKKIKKEPPSKNTSIAEDETETQVIDVGDGDLTMYLGDGNRTLNRSWDQERKHHLVKDVDVQLHREVVLTDRESKYQYKEPLSKNNSIAEDETETQVIDERDGDLTMYLGDGNRTLNRSWDQERKHRLVKDVNVQLHREVVLTDRDLSKAATSEVHLPRAAPSPCTAPLRPNSASALVRRQLELAPPPHKRRLSLRYMQRNKTSPERISMLMYEPSSGKRQLDKGDFEMRATLN